MKLKSYQDLHVWQKARIFVKEVYQATQEFPSQEKYSLITQLRRASVSIPSNIAEGYNRRTTQEYLRFVNIAYGSLGEVETQLILSMDLGFLSSKKCEDLLEKSAEIGRMCNGLENALRKRLTTEPRIPNPDPFTFKKDHAPYAA